MSLHRTPGGQIVCQFCGKGNGKPGQCAHCGSRLADRPPAVADREKKIPPVEQK